MNWPPSRQTGRENFQQRLSSLRNRIASLEKNFLDNDASVQESQLESELNLLEKEVDALCPLIEGQDGFFRLIVEEVTDAVVLTDERADILYVNPVTEKLLGYRPEEMLGRNIRMLMPVKEQGQHDKYVKDYAETGQAHIIGIGRDVMCRKKSGDLTPFELRISETFVRGSRYFIGTLRDISRRKEAEKKAREATFKAIRANKAKSDFLANMSHELRTPLNAIIGYSEMLQQQLFGDIGHEKYLDYARYIHISGNRLLNLVNDVLDLSKVEAGRYELVKAYADMEMIIENIRYEFLPMAKAAGVRLVMICPEKIGEVFVDEKALKQILANLISNAIKFSHADRDVEVTFTPLDRRHISITVRDEGIGMSPEEMEVALSSFGQVQSSHVRNHQGTGLGLPLTRSLVELHGGEFFLESEPGKGTIVRVSLPIRDENQKLL